MDRHDWDTRYSASDLVWSAGPNMFVEEVAAPLPPGRALDLAAGEARNALWLVDRGWDATAVDFSAVALERARRLAEERLGERADRLTTVVADLHEYDPSPEFDLVMLVYLQLAAAERAAILRRAADGVAPGGRLLVIAHHSDNVTAGYGGPPDPAVNYTEADVVADLAGTGLAVERADRVLRPVETADGTRHAIDALVVLTRPAEAPRA